MSNGVDDISPPHFFRCFLLLLSVVEAVRHNYLAINTTHSFLVSGRPFWHWRRSVFTSKDEQKKAAVSCAYLINSNCICRFCCVHPFFTWIFIHISLDYFLPFYRLHFHCQAWHEPRDMKLGKNERQTTNQLKRIFNDNNNRFINSWKQHVNRGKNISGKWRWQQKNKCDTNARKLYATATHTDQRQSQGQRWKW